MPISYTNISSYIAKCEDDYNLTPTCIARYMAWLYNQKPEMKGSYIGARANHIREITFKITGRGFGYYEGADYW